MKKITLESLEKLKKEKFQITQEEQAQIMGGYGWDWSYRYSWTNIGGGTAQDRETYDICTY